MKATPLLNGALIRERGIAQILHDKSVSHYITEFFDLFPLNDLFPSNVLFPSKAICSLQT